MTLLLFSVKYFHFSFWSYFIFGAAAFFVYLNLPPVRAELKKSYIILMLLGLAAIRFVFGEPTPLLLVVFLFLFAVLVFVFLALQSFQFSDRFLVYGIWNTALSLFFFLEIFYFWSALGWVVFLVVFGGVAAIFGEALGFFGVAAGRLKLSSALTLGYLSTALAFLVSYLPLGFLNAAVFLSLFLLLLRDILVFHFRGNLNFPFILRELTFFITIGTLIFAAAKWVL